MLEELYKDFDEFCGYFDVYKVETIGDAYCVASGLHRAGSFDAHKVAWMALRMLEACNKHITHDGQPIRVSIHCLFHNRMNSIVFFVLCLFVFFLLGNFRCELVFIPEQFLPELWDVKCHDIAYSVTMSPSQTNLNRTASSAK